MTEISFTRYLAAKQTVDDRALNRRVWERLRRELGARVGSDRLRVLEVGAGIGSMFERLAMARLLDLAAYTAVDLDPENTAVAQRRLAGWGRANGLQVGESEGGLSFSGSGIETRLELLTDEALDFARRQSGRRFWDLLVANAFLDLVDVPAALAAFFSLLEPGGLFYFTINFDGLTLLEPPFDPGFDELVEQVYHLTMDERTVSGRPTGASRTGRRLFADLRNAGVQLLEAGSSDWVVSTGPAGYPNDEAYFLHFLIHTMQAALQDRPEIDGVRLARWTEGRHAQVERGELVFIAHQLDFLGIKPVLPAGGTV